MSILPDTLPLPPPFVFFRELSVDIRGSVYVDGEGTIILRTSWEDGREESYTDLTSFFRTLENYEVRMVIDASLLDSIPTNYDPCKT